jgi:hypothetical protein
MGYRPATFEVGRRLRLKHLVQPSRALEVLNERINALNNIRMDGSTPDRVMQSRDGYIAWVEDTEVVLSGLTHDDTVIEMLHTARYWAIRNLVPHDARPVPLIMGEQHSQRDALEHMKQNLEMHVARAVGAPGHIVVLDTNTLLHYQLPNSIKWAEVVGFDPVRLVIPLRVIEELDAKKYGDSAKLRSRARDLLPKLEELAGMGGAPSPLWEGMSLEVLVEFDTGAARVKPADADEEILFICRELWQLSGQAEGVTLVTGDTAIRMRAQALGGIRTVALPDKYRRVAD